MGEVNALLRRDEGTESGSETSEREERSWNGINQSQNSDVVEEYLDDDRFTTITVEAVDVSRDGFHKVDHEANSESNNPHAVPSLKIEQTLDRGKAQDSKRSRGKERLAGAKKKKKKFKYESKAERKFTRQKERSRNRRQAKARTS